MKYEKLAEEDKARYQKEMKVYNSKQRDEDDDEDDDDGE